MTVIRIIYLRCKLTQTFQKYRRLQYWAYLIIFSSDVIIHTRQKQYFNNYWLNMFRLFGSSSFKYGKITNWLSTLTTRKNSSQLTQSKQPTSNDFIYVTNAWHINCAYFMIICLMMMTQSARPFWWGDVMTEWLAWIKCEHGKNNNKN